MESYANMVGNIYLYCSYICWQWKVWNVTIWPVFWFSVVKCKPEDVISPDHASVQCFHPYGNFSYDSQCEYSCEEGYDLKGSSTTRCTSTTEWSSKPPTCERELNLRWETFTDAVQNCLNNLHFPLTCLWIFLQLFNVQSWSNHRKAKCSVSIQ